MSEHVWVDVESSTRIKSKACETCDAFAFRGDIHDIRPCPGSVLINIRLEADYGLKVSQVWPDGDWPDEITAEAVAAVMKQDGRWYLAHDWDLTPDYFVSVGRGPEVKADV